MFPQLPHVGVGGISRLGEDQRVTSTEVDKAVILADIVFLGLFIYA
jgi:hypothetical protein